MDSRSVLGILLLLILGTVSEIGPVRAQNIELGLEIGIGSASLSYDAGPPYTELIGIPEWDTRPRLCYSILAFVQVPISKSLSLLSGLRLSQVGDKASHSNSTYRREKRQQYLSVPIRIRYNLFDSPIYVSAGPEFGYLIRAVSTWEAPSPYPPYPQTDKKFNGFLKRINVVLGAGIGASYKIFGRRMYAQVYHNEGVTGNIRDIEGQRFGIRRIGGYNWRTRETTLNIGYLFGN